MSVRNYLVCRELVLDGQDHLRDIVVSRGMTENERTAMEEQRLLPAVTEEYRARLERFLASAGPWTCGKAIMALVLCDVHNPLQMQMH